MKNFKFLILFSLFLVIFLGLPQFVSAELLCQCKVSFIDQDKVCFNEEIKLPLKPDKTSFTPLEMIPLLDLRNCINPYDSLPEGEIDVSGKQITLLENSSYRTTDTDQRFNGECKDFTLNGYVKDAQGKYGNLDISSCSLNDVSGITLAPDKVIPSVSPGDLGCACDLQVGDKGLFPCVAKKVLFSGSTSLGKLATDFVNESELYDKHCIYSFDSGDIFADGSTVNGSSKESCEGIQEDNTISMIFTNLVTGSPTDHGYRVKLGQCVFNAQPTAPTTPPPEKPTDKPTAPPSAQSLNKLGTNLPDLIGRVIKTIMGVVGTIALIIFIYAGILWMTAHGNSEREKKAMDTIVWASIGILVILSSYALVDFILDAIK